MIPTGTFDDRLLIHALELVANGVVVTDPGGTVLWVNQAFTTLTGYEAEEVLGHNPRILRSQQNEIELYEELWETISAGRTWAGQLFNRRKDGSEYVEEMTITPVRGADGEIAQYIAIKQDVTERVELAIEAYRSAQRYSGLFADAEVAMLLADPGTGRFVDVN
jgi:PAS domain S-box-containing protein